MKKSDERITVGGQVIIGRHGPTGTRSGVLTYTAIAPIDRSGSRGVDTEDRMAKEGELQCRISDPVYDPQAWSAIESLWVNDPIKSPIQSPEVLKHHSEHISDRTVIFTGGRDGRPLAGVVLRRVGRHLSFLSDLKTDVNHFLFDPSATGEDKVAFFRSLVLTIKAKNWNWTLNNQPAWVEHLDQLVRVAREEGLYCSSTPYSACPIVEADTPQELFKYVNGFRELRYRVNRLRKRDDVVFEIDTDENYLEEWVTEFCDVHVLRWAGTPTPSHFNEPGRRTFFLGCLKAWCRAGLLVRFAIKVADQRIGFVVALRSGDVLIHHNTTYHPDHARSSPGKALIHIMSEWMAQSGYRILDFGNGREEYKYTVATGENKLRRIFIGGRSDLRFVLSSEIIRSVYRMPKAYAFYQDHIKRRLR